MKIRVELKQSYGHIRFYPMCDAAKLFAELVERKVLHAEHIEIIRKIGVEVEVTQAPKQEGEA